MSEYISLGEIPISPEGENLFPVASYEITGVEPGSSPGISAVTYLKEEYVEQRFRDSRGTPCLGRELKNMTKRIETSNLPTDRFIIEAGRLIEREPRGVSYLDTLGGSFDDLYDDGDLTEEEREAIEVARDAALGAITRSVWVNYRPVTDPRTGEMQVNPHPVSVGKTN